MSRALRIAAREYMAFVRTVGFWLSICLMPLGLRRRDRSSPASPPTRRRRRSGDLDFTGAGYGRDPGQALAARGPRAQRHRRRRPADRPIAATPTRAESGPTLRRAHHAGRRPARRRGDRARHGREAGARPLDPQHQRARPAGGAERGAERRARARPSSPARGCRRRRSPRSTPTSPQVTAVFAQERGRPRLDARPPAQHRRLRHGHRALER